MKPIFNKKEYSNCKLKSINAYQDKNSSEWRLQLVYTYEDDIGLHELIIPCVDPPFPQKNLPMMGRDYTDLPMMGGGCSVLYMESFGCLPRIYKADARLFGSCDVERDIFFCDRIIEYKPREMSVEEIEKKLGYKIKIVSKE